MSGRHKLRHSWPLHCVCSVISGLHYDLLIFILGQSKNIADRAIEDIIKKQAVLKKMKQKLLQAKAALEHKARARNMEGVLAGEADIGRLEAVITRIEDSINIQTSALGITAKSKLHKLKGNTFLRLRMNALALHQRIIQNSVSRRFEIERFDHLVQYGDRMGGLHIFWTLLQISLTFPLANQDHDKLKQNLNWCKGGHEQLAKSYKNSIKICKTLLLRAMPP